MPLLTNSLRKAAHSTVRIRTFHAHGLEFPLDYGGDLDPLLVALVDQNGKRKTPSVRVRPARRLRRASNRPRPTGLWPAPGIVGIRRDGRVIYPSARFVRAYGGFAHAHERPLDHRLAVHGVGQSLTDPLVGKQGTGQIETQKCVSGGEVFIFFPVFIPVRSAGLAQILLGRQPQKIDLARLGFQKYGGKIGDDAVHYLIY